MTALDRSGLGTDVVAAVVTGPGDDLDRVGGPVVGGIEEALIREGDPIVVDGSSGFVDLPAVVERHVVTAFLHRSDGRVLVLRRSERVGSFRGRWAAVSGYLEEPSTDRQARKEVLEETGIDLGSRPPNTVGAVVLARDGGTIFVAHPMRFDVADPSVRLDWEHTESRWVLPEQGMTLDTVPGLWVAWARVSPAPASEATSVGKKR